MYVCMCACVRVIYLCKTQKKIRCKQMSQQQNTTKYDKIRQKQQQQQQQQQQQPQSNVYSQFVFFSSL